MAEVVLHNDSQRITFNLDQGGRAVSWQVNGQEVLAHVGSHPVQNGMYPMVPWAGRLRDNRVTAQTAARNGLSQDADFDPPINFMEWAIHGTVLDREVDSWELLDSEFRASQVIKGTPWEGQVNFTWRMSDLSLITEIEVFTPKAMPAVVGWHPYFLKVLWGGAAQWEAPGAQIATRVGAFADGSLSDWKPGSSTVDDAFFVPNRELTVQWGSVAQLTARNSHPWFVVFEELDYAISIEPQTAPPNALANPIGGPAPIARANEPVRMTTDWVWSFS